MDIEWTRCLWKINQILGGAKRQDTEAIFINETYLGTCEEFQNYLSVNYNITMSLWSLKYKQLASIDIQNYYNNKSTFVRMVFEVNNWELGHVVFELFDKQVPKTCKYFKRLCINKTEGYLNSFVHRIDINNGFIQAGRILNKMAYLKKENFSVSHDRRGVLSLASRRTYFNGPEFIISFQPNPWMNDKYVAFGHAVDGEKTLKTIEKLSKAREISDGQIRITSCDVLPGCTRSVETKLDKFLHALIGKIVLKAMYISAYGKPKPLHMPVTTDLEYIESIIRKLTSNVMGRVEDSASPQETEPLIIADYSKSKRSGQQRTGSLTIPSAPSSCKDETKRKHSLIKLTPYSAGFNATSGRMLGTEKMSAIKSKRSGACGAISIDKKAKYGIDLSADHKDYWKYKKIYDGIAN
ncbi:uncharacterized protein LOC111033050 [Myzus persicae]|uniref:uncharacterized protein LOC111033050 n=1 Tax=Myzus persicae TaxID=13164 RepID=UPI000B932A2C|nr:uncharacterized protein LOC111033050 [Myzus persicae]